MWKEVMWKRTDGKSVIQFCRETGTSYGSIMRYIKKGNSVDDSCEIAFSRKGRKDNNVRYRVGDKSLVQYCKENGLSYYSMYNRARKEK